MSLIQNPAYVMTTSAFSVYVKDSSLYSIASIVDGATTFSTPGAVNTESAIVEVPDVN